LPRLQRAGPVMPAVRRELLRRAGTALLALWLGPLAMAADPKVTKSEWRSIRTIISRQLAALKAGDASKAFAYASPGIRAQFGDAQNFMAMVRSAYTPLLDARYTEFLEGAVIDGLVVQPLRLIGPDDTVLVALYTLEKQEDGNWRIASCMLAPSTVRAA